jgi:hypothetical protein
MHSSLLALLIAAAAAMAVTATAPAAPTVVHVLKGTAVQRGPCYQQDYVDLDFRRKGYVDGPCPKKFNKVLQRGHETVCKGQSDENLKYCSKTTITYNVTEYGIQAGEQAADRRAAVDSSVGVEAGYPFGPCVGPGNGGTHPYFTQVYGNVTSATGTLEWWPEFRPNDVFRSKTKTESMVVKCSNTGDFNYECHFDQITCNTGLKQVYAMCDAGVFKDCKRS